MEQEPEQVLVAAAQGGDAEAFNVLTRRYFGMVYMIGYSRLHQREAAEELAQEVFLRVFLHLATLDHPEFFSTWITRIARNLSDTWYTQGRTRSRLVPQVPLGEMEIEMPDTRMPSARDTVAAREQEDRLRSAVLALATHDREVLLLHYSEGLTKAEIARRYGVHPSSVGRHLDSVVATLRRTCGAAFEPGLHNLRSRESAAVKACGLVLATAALSQATRASLAAQCELGALATAPASMSAPMFGALLGAHGAKVIISAVCVAALVIAATVHFSHRTPPPPAPDAKVRAPRVTGSGKAAKRPAPRSRRVSSASSTPTAQAWNVQAVAPALSPDTTGTMLRGKVVKPDGSPAAGATVMILSEKYWTRPTAMATSDASGMFQHPLPPGSYWMRATLGSLYARGDEVRVRPDGTVNREPELLLKQGGTVHGTALDISTGKPVEGAMIVTDHGDRVLTDASGNYMVTGISRGQHSICAYKDGMFRPVVHFDTTTQADAEVALKMKPGGTVRGTVTDDSGRAIAGARVRAMCSGSIYILGTQLTATDQRGRYAISGYDVDQPVWSVGVDAPGYAKAQQGPIPFPPDSSETQIDFVLGQASMASTGRSGTTETTKLRTIQGVITAPDDRPVSGALVAYGMSESHPDYVAVLSDAMGRYRLERVGTGNNLVSVQKAGMAPAFGVSGTSESATVDFRLGEQHALGGRIVDENGEPMAGLSVAAMGDISSLRGALRLDNDKFCYLKARATADSNGEFTLDSLPAGKVFVDAYGPGDSEIRNVPLEVDRRDHVLTVTASGQISGTVLDAETGKPVQAFTVRLTFPSKPQPDDPQGGIWSYLVEGVAFNAPDGTFTVFGLKRNAIVRVEVWVDGYMMAAADRVHTGSSADIDHGANLFRMVRAAPLEGIVMTGSETSTPVANARVAMLDIASLPLHCNRVSPRNETDHHWVVARTGADGKFRFAHVPFARVALVAEKAGMGRTVVSDVGTSRSVEISMQPSGAVRGTVPGRPAAVMRIRSKDRNAYYWAHGKADLQGRYEFRDVPCGVYQVFWLNGNDYELLIDDVQVQSGGEQGN